MQNKFRWRVQQSSLADSDLSSGDLGHQFDEFYVSIFKSVPSIFGCVRTRFKWAARKYRGHRVLPEGIMEELGKKGII